MGPVPFLDKNSQNELLAIARRSIESVFTQERYKSGTENSMLHEKRGAFVTLRESGHLRGCIGQIEAARPLHETVFEMAHAAAFSDPRFEPLAADEFKKITIEISVLTPPRRVQNASEIRKGRHGVIVEQDFRKGVFLPQVWEETGWTKEEFLNNVCTHKAGISASAWKTGEAQLFVFEAQVFGEK